ncbi:crotonase/enoyl-CoA hydratase family protein [Mycolicibacterium porcinum]|uniref:crotonase/enoyl-CoA hydratase family protein n=1 Tax=Mycolicibacterium porcinum TaxID=39693 RepID=UPI00055DBE0B|nr:enoyl-CoA hydratase [Mycolicibacterium porcinum]
MTPSQHGDALVECRAGITIITLNRPAARNAVNREVSVIVGDALQRAQEDVSVRAVVLTGAGAESFCAGADLKAAARGEAIDHPDHPEWGFAGFTRHFIDKPVIAAVNGAALGGGTELILASDLVVAAESARFGLPEVKHGLMAGAGGAFRITEQLPRKIALEMLLTGEPMSADVAARWGLINHVVAQTAVLDTAVALAERISANAPLAVQASKRVASNADGDGPPNREQWRRSWREFKKVLASDDAKEGPRAFAEKRLPTWTSR